MLLTRHKMMQGWGLGATKVRSSTKQGLFGVTEKADSTITSHTKQTSKLAGLMVMVNRQSSLSWRAAAEGTDPSLGLKHVFVIFEGETVLVFEVVGPRHIGVGLSPLPLPRTINFGVGPIPVLLRSMGCFGIGRSPRPRITRLAQTKCVVRAVGVTRSDALSHHIYSIPQQESGI